jgi:hypothetical protein
MSVSNYRFSFNAEDKSINIPIQINFDMEGRDDAIDILQNQIKEDVINPISDFETTRFSHSTWENDLTKTQIHYKFNFFNQQGQTDFLINPPNINQWDDDYQNEGFLDEEIYYFSNSFKKSFYKLDFYDKNTTENQKILFSVILPTQQGEKEPGILFDNPNLTVLVKKPYMVLDSIGTDKEGFYFYWLKNQTYLSQTEMYMSCKFFNAKKGQFVRMMNTPQSSFSGPNVYDFNKSQYFYYKVFLDYLNYEYTVYREIPNGANSFSYFRVGEGSTNPINWYEYVNPI